MPFPPRAENRRITPAQGVSACGENGIVRSAARDEMLTLSRNSRYLPPNRSSIRPIDLTVCRKIARKWREWGGADINRILSNEELNHGNSHCLNHFGAEKATDDREMNAKLFVN
jgi:hypothetical protein